MPNEIAQKAKLENLSLASLSSIQPDPPHASQPDHMNRPPVRANTIHPDLRAIGDFRDIVERPKLAIAEINAARLIR
ncbi:hypothetical protein [Burkholderia ubonensis]|uniref:hypothetical protein n=1 Tax=Burkholderia ubonensis TaxID=101571 RepID=UPI000A816A60|nr:hypothetical protein [Burkholderia ubonensis]